MLQILRQAIDDDDTKTHFRLIYCARNSDDIILIDEMVRLDESDRIDVVIVLTGKDVPKDWQYLGKDEHADTAAFSASSSDVQFIVRSSRFRLECTKGFVKIRT